MMKRLLFVFLLLNAAAGSAQQTKKPSGYFIVLYTVGQNWDTTKQYHEQRYFHEHSTHLSTLRKNKTIAIGARYSETGMIVIRATDENEAKALVNKDPAVQNKLFKAEVFLFEPFYEGCITEQ